MLSEETADRALRKLTKIDGQRTIVVLDQEAVSRVRKRMTDLAQIEVITVREMIQTS